jgi:nucleoside-triphosphatase THEP1
MHKPPIYILNNEVGVGKTTSLQNWILHENPSVVGFLMPVLDGKRVIQLLPQNTFVNVECEAKNENALHVGRFVFNNIVFKNAIEHSLFYSNFYNPDYLVIDEIGPLELHQSKGLFSLLQLIFQHTIQFPKIAIIVVVRNSCLPNFIQLVNNQHFQHCSISITENKIRIL